MSKELEAFERIKNHTLSYTGDTYKTLTDSREMQVEDLNIIENALKRLETIEYQDRFVDEVWKTTGLPNYSKEARENNKKLKAFEIVKEKQISIADFIYACMCSKKDLKEYHNCDSNYEFAATCVGWEKEYLTKEEFDLLKEVLL